MKQRSCSGCKSSYSGSSSSTTTTTRSSSIRRRPRRRHSGRGRALKTRSCRQGVRADCLRYLHNTAISSSHSARSLGVISLSNEPLMSSPMSLMSLGLIRLQEVGRRGLLRGWGFYTKGASTRPLRPTLGSKPLGFGAWGGRYGGDDPRTSESLARTGVNRIEWGGWATGARG